MVAVVGVLYLVTQLVMRSLMFILGNFVEKSVRANFAPFVRMLMIINSGINLFVYIW